MNLALRSAEVAGLLTTVRASGFLYKSIHISFWSSRKPQHPVRAAQARKADTSSTVVIRRTPVADGFAGMVVVPLRPFISLPLALAIHTQSGTGDFWWGTYN